MASRGPICLRYLTTALAIAFAVLSTSVDAVDLPTATHGFESWAAVVGKAMSFGGKNKDQTLQALESFQKTVQSKMQKQASSFQKIASGDFTDILVKLASVRTEISAPVFFQNSGGADTALTDSIAGASFGFTGVGYAPCAIPITPIGVGIFPQGINIQPNAFNIAPTGMNSWICVNIQPQGASISPSLIVIGPYDTTVAGQGLSIAPALITVAPTREVVNPVGPLSISDVLVDVTVPNPP